MALAHCNLESGAPNAEAPGPLRAEKTGVADNGVDTDAPHTSFTPTSCKTVRFTVSQRPDIPIMHGRTTTTYKRRAAHRGMLETCRDLKRTTWKADPVSPSGSEDAQSP